MLDCKILLATDDNFLSDRCANSLRAFNVELLTCSDDSAQIISGVLTKEPTLVILCGSSPHYVYFDIIDCINASSLAQKPLFVIVAETDAEVSGMLQRSPSILTYLTKPIDPATILTCISTYMSVYSKMLSRSGEPDLLLESTTTEVMFKLGIPANVKGYQYLREALMLSAANFEYLHGITKLLYPTIAERYNSSPTRVERAIRHSIDLLWSQGNADVIHAYFGQRPSIQTKPTNSELIAVLADNIRLKMKQAKQII